MKTLPNILTALRFVLLPILVALYFFPSNTAQVAGFAIFVLASATDFFDGYLARCLKATSNFGQCMDPIADKCLVITVLFLLVAKQQIYGVYLIASLLILLRETMVSGLRIFLAARQVSIPSSRLAKWKTTIQMISLAAYLLYPALPPQYYGQAFAEGTLLIAGALTVITGWQYIRQTLPHLRAGK